MSINVIHTIMTHCFSRLFSLFDCAYVKNVKFDINTSFEFFHFMSKYETNKICI